MSPYTKCLSVSAHMGTAIGEFAKHRFIYKTICHMIYIDILSNFKSNALMATFFRYGLDKTTGTVNRVRMVRDMGT